MAIALATSTVLAGTAVYAQSTDVEAPPTPAVEAPAETTTETTTETTKEAPVVETNDTTGILHKFDENGEACEIAGNVVYLEHGNGTLNLRVPPYSPPVNSEVDNVEENNNNNEHAIRYEVAIENDTATVSRNIDGEGISLFGIGRDDNGEGDDPNKEWELKPCT